MHSPVGQKGTSVGKFIDRKVQFKGERKQEFLQAPLKAFCSKYLDNEDFLKLF